MSFKIDFDKIADGLTKEFTKEISPSTGNILRNELEKQQLETKTQEECDNLASIQDKLGVKPRKTKVPIRTKIKKAGLKNIAPKDKNIQEPTEIELIERIRNKEVSLETNKKFLKAQSAKSKPHTELVAVGRHLVGIDKDLFNDKYEEFLKKNSLATNDTFIQDSLRGRAGKFWSIDTKSKNFIFVGNQQDYKNSKLFDFDFYEIIDDDEVSDFGRTYQNVAIENKQNKFQTATKKYSKDLWKSFIHGHKYQGSTLTHEKLDFTFESTIKEDTPFFDHAFDMSLPFSEDELKVLNGLNGSLSAKVEPQYNFFIEDYETSIANKNVLENTLPNMYVMLSEMNSTNPNPEFKNLISLDGTIKTDTTKLLTFKKKHVQTKVSRVYDLKTNPVGEYFDLFGKQYQDAVKANVIKKLNTKFSNIGISIDDIPLIQKFSDKEELFPLNVTIKFSTDPTTTFAQILKDTNLSDTFTSKIINRVATNKSDPFTLESAVEVTEQNEFQNAHKNTKFASSNYRSWDLADLISDLEDGEEPLVSNAIYLGEHDITEKAQNRPEFKFFRSLNSAIFQSKIQTLIRQKLRSYEDVINGKTAYSETVLYRIAKFIGNAEGNQPIQNIFIPNATSLDVLEYIDTQVKYDKRYTYVIYAYQMVIGNKYWYSDLRTDEYEHHATFRVYQEPSMKLVEVPYYTFVARIIDIPPAPPDVKFVAYKGVDNKFLLMFNNNVMDYKALPITIKQTDQENFAKVREAQRLPANAPLSFGGDDRIVTYEVYRLTTKPTSYSQFVNALLKTVNTDVSSKTIQKATSGATIDNIEPNKKYWYIFRAIDIHGHISNPTFLYEAEIINEHGTIFPLVNVVDFKEPFEKEPSKTAKRFIQIIPTILQGLIDEDHSGFLNAKSAEDIKTKIALGLAEQKVWGKTFRLRLISRNTGKKIDFDINFQHRSVTKVKAE